METQKSRIENKYGQQLLDSYDLREILLRGKSINYLTAVDEEDINQFRQYQNQLLDDCANLLEPVTEQLSIEEFHEQNSAVWIFPNSYQNIDVKSWLLNKCKTNVERDRVEEEYVLFEQKDLIMLLRLFIYLIDYMRANNFIWGVGRGSSVASYILYLIGVHRVDSIKYNLDINDYLK